LFLRKKSQEVVEKKNPRSIHTLESESHKKDSSFGFVVVLEKDQVFWQGEDARDRKRRRNARRLLLVQRNQQEMGWVGDSHMGTSDIRKQLHICKLLSSAQDSDAV
jgi:hypothetical protein